MRNKDYQKRFKDARKKEGLVRIELWIKPEWKQLFLDKLNKLKEKDNE